MRKDVWMERRLDSFGIEVDYCTCLVFAWSQGHALTRVKIDVRPYQPEGLFPQPRFPARGIPRIGNRKGLVQGRSPFVKEAVTGNDEDFHFLGEN